MAAKQASETRIYLDVTRLFNMIIDTTVNFPRDVKYTIGSKLHDYSVELMLIIAEAYSEKSNQRKLTILGLAQAKFGVIKTMVRTAGERQWIKGRGRHAALIDIMDGINKQLSAWKGAVERKLTASPESEG